MDKPKPNLNVLYLAILVATALRLYKLGAQSLWGDEALTVLYYTAGDSIIEVWNRIWTSGGHPPFYFLTVFHWFRLGHSEFMLRFPSLIFGVASIPVMYALVARLYGHRSASVAAWVVAVSPIHIWYSQEARMYALQLLLVLFATLFLVKAWQERRLRDKALFGVTAVLALFTHMATALIIAGQGLFVVLMHARNRRVLAAWIGLFAVVMAAFTPWVVSFVRDGTRDGGKMGVGYGRRPTMLDPLYAFYTFTVGYSLGPSTAELHELGAGRILMSDTAEIVAPAIVFGMLTILGLRMSRKRNGGAFVLVASLLIVPTAIATAGSRLPGFPLNPRYILPAVVPYWIILALGVEACVQRKSLAVVPVAALLITGLSLHNHYFNPRYEKQDMRSATNLLNQRTRKDDAVILSSVELGGPFIYYFRRADIPYFGYPPGGGLVHPDRVASDLQRIADGRQRIWLVLGRTWSSDPDGLMERHLNQHYPVADRHRYPGVTVLCYDLAHR